MARHLKEIGSVSYISTAPFNTNFYNYVITSSAPTFVKIGSLVPVTNASSANCPAGNILRENGKKLYPGAHPGVTTYMVGVFDIVSGLKGYINPNDPMFAPYNTDRPLYQPDSVYTTDGLTKNLGPSVLTLGDIAASGDVTTAGQVIASEQIRSSTITTLSIDSSGVCHLDVSLGQVFILNVTGNFTLMAMGANINPGAVVFLKLTGSSFNMTLGSGVTSPMAGPFGTPGNYMFFSDGITLNL